MVLDYINSGTVSPFLKLVDCGGTECICCAENDLFALSLKLLQLLSRVDGSEFLNSCFNAHRISPPYSWRFQP